MRAIVTSLILILNFFFQSTIASKLAFADVKPNTAIVLIVCFAYLRTDVNGAIIGFCAGMLQDLFFGRIVGYNALVYALIGFFCGKPFKDYFQENYIFPFLMTAVSVFVYETITYITHFMLFGRVDTVYYLLNTILPSTAYSTALSLPVFWLVFKTEKKIDIFINNRY